METQSEQKLGNPRWVMAGGTFLQVYPDLGNASAGRNNWGISFSKFER